jgi:uncharacterized membrane protein
MSVNSANQSLESHRSDYYKPRTVEDMTERNVQAIVQLEEAARANRSGSDRIAGAIAKFCGSMSFVWAHVILFAAWLILNIIPGIDHFDPFPFTFLTLIVSLEAIFLSTFILISQNLEMRVSERRNQLDLQINLLTEQENTKMLTILERIAERVGAKQTMTRAFKYWNMRPSRKSLSIRSKRRRGKILRPQLKVTDAINSQLIGLIHRVFNTKKVTSVSGSLRKNKGK